MCGWPQPFAGEFEDCDGDLEDKRIRESLENENDFAVRIGDVDVD